MRQYLDLLEHVLTTGTDRPDRTGTGTRGVFGYQMRFDLSRGFPVTTTKKLHLKSIIHELLWFLAGDTNIRVSQRQWRHDLGRMGRREWRSRAGLWQAVALLAGPRRRRDRPDRPCSESVEDKSSFAPADRVGVESGRGGRHGAAAVPLPVPVLRVGRQAVLPALPAVRRHLPGHTVQHRLLCAADHDGGAGGRTEAGRLRADAAATRISTPTISSRRASSFAARRRRCRRCASIRRSRTSSASASRIFRSRTMSPMRRSGRRSRCRRPAGACLCNLALRAAVL